MVEHVFNPFAVSASGGKSSAFKSAFFLSCVFIIYSVVALVVEPMMADHLVESYNNRTHGGSTSAHLQTDNPLFSETVEYRSYRWPQLLWLTRQETEFARRMLFALCIGALIGLERRESNRGAGIRTMSLVSLGSCIFTLGSLYAFEGGTQKWDASRVSAALPSGVGFLGGALIFKDSGQIKGLTTACGVWLSCSVGLCAGGGMYFVSGFGVMAMIAMLRFGPRSPDIELEEAEAKLTANTEEETPFPRSSSTPLLSAEGCSAEHKVYQRKMSGMSAAYIVSHE